MRLFQSAQQKGFTLIELLVVMAVLSILIGIGINTFAIAQKKARDTRRKADLKAMQVALEIYYQDHGTYCPGGNSYGCPWNSSFSDSRWGWNGSAINSLKSIFVPNYIGSIPHDPKNYPVDTTDYGDYYLSAQRNTYTLSAILEDPNDKDARPGCAGTRNYCITPGN